MRRFFFVLMACNGGGLVVCVALLFVVTGSCGRLVNLESLEDSRGNFTVDQERAVDPQTHQGSLVIGQNSFAFRGSRRWRLPAVDAGYQADMGM